MTQGGTAAGDSAECGSNDGQKDMRRNPLRGFRLTSSSFAAYVERGVYAPDWAAAPSLKVPGDT